MQMKGLLDHIQRKSKEMRMVSSVPTLTRQRESEQLISKTFSSRLKVEPSTNLQAFLPAIRTLEKLGCWLSSGAEGEEQGDGIPHVTNFRTLCQNNFLVPGMAET